MHVAAVQFDIVWEDKAANHRIIEKMLDDADVPRDAFVLLPELGDTGFSFDLDTIINDQTLAWATTQARERGIWLQAGYARRGPDGRGRNCASIITPQGVVAGTYEKVHPFGYGGEIEHYAGGDRVLVRRVGDAAVAPMICYDLRFPELWRRVVPAAEVFAIGASWPDARHAHWTSLITARAIENQAYVVSCNRIGTDPHLGYAGGSIIVSPMGEVLAEAGTGPAVIQADLDLDALRAWRATFPALHDIRSDLVGSLAIDG